MIDVARYDPAAPPAKYNLCGAIGVPGNQGLQVGWTDVYAQSIDCQYVPIDGLAAGTYWLEVQVNPEHLLPESDYSNNSAAIKFLMTLSKGNQNPQITLVN
jgi:hypothetical protein